MLNVIRQVIHRTQNVVAQGANGNAKFPRLLCPTQLELSPNPINFIRQKFMSMCPLIYSSRKSSAGLVPSSSYCSPLSSLSLNGDHSALNFSPSPMFGGLVIVPSRGMKIKGRVKRRCKDCYLIWIDGILHNKCKARPRHTQMQKEKYFANTRLLTHASMSAKRPW